MRGINVLFTLFTTSRLLHSPVCRSRRPLTQRGQHCVAESSTPQSSLVGRRTWTCRRPSRDQVHWIAWSSCVGVVLRAWLRTVRSGNIYKPFGDFVEHAKPGIIRPGLEVLCQAWHDTSRSGRTPTSTVSVPCRYHSLTPSFPTAIWSVEYQSCCLSLDHWWRHCAPCATGSWWSYQQHWWPCWWAGDLVDELVPLQGRTDVYSEGDAVFSA